MKKRLFFSALSAAVVLTAGYCGYRHVVNSSESDLFLANVEALSAGEKIDCNYNRSEGQCEVEVGAHGKIEILGETIIKAGADGKISFDGKVICSSGGNASCTPVECEDLYKILR